MLDSSIEPLRAPFPWFGGKSRAADIVWERFGSVANYVEPFFGSGAVLLSRPHAPGIETVNDADHFVANFFRALQAEPEALARLSDWPVNETDLHARHLWLVTTGRERIAHLDADPAAYDVQVAAWWVWGLCAWIGGGWCSGEGPWQSIDGKLQKGCDAGRGIKRQLPHLGGAGQGINRQLPHLGDAGRGINRKRPHLNRSMGIHSKAQDTGSGMFDAIAERLRRVRVCCGDWSRIMGETVTTNQGITAVFLDPPYSDAAGRDENLYAVESLSVGHDVRAWAIANGDNPKLRIALCGYEGEHVMPADWETVPWKAQGGYGSQGDGAGRDNARRERIWFSPACLKPHRDRTLFDLLEEVAA